MNLNKLKNTFKKNGYVKINCIDKKKLVTLKYSFAKMIEISLKKNLNHLVKIKNKSKKLIIYLMKVLSYYKRKIITIYRNYMTKLLNQVIIMI